VPSCHCHCQPHFETLAPFRVWTNGRSSHIVEAALEPSLMNMLLQTITSAAVDDDDVPSVPALLLDIRKATVNDAF